MNKHKYFNAQDNNPYKGENQYRIKEVFNNGTYRYSEIRQITLEYNKRNINIFPNPSTGLIYLELDAFAGLKTEINISNGLGEIVYRQLLERAEKDPLLLDLQTFPGGIYFVQVKAEGRKVISEKVIITKL